MLTLPQRLKMRDPAAWEEFVASYSRRIRSYVFRRLYSTRTEDIDDVVQNVLVCVWTVIERYDPSKPFSTWVLSIAHYRLTDAIRRTMRDKSVAAGDAIYNFSGSEWGSVLDAVVHAETAESVRKIVSEELGCRGVEQSAMADVMDGMLIRAASKSGVSRRRLAGVKYKAMKAIRCKVRKVLA